MNKFFVFLLCCLIGQNCLAKPISRQSALQYAKSYLQQKSRVLSTKKHDVDLSLAYECRPKSTRSVSGEDPLYYVFNQGKADGFIVISGDDRMKPVLGCVDAGDFSDRENHPGMKWWLIEVEQTMSEVMSVPDDGLFSSRTTTDHNFPSKVLPLVSTKWGQSEPYNLRCPVDSYYGEHTLSGCVAVAMAQILNKWKSPLHPQGFVDYISENTYHITENLSDFTFDWDNMLDEYDRYSTTAEKKAVADLMYACGIAVKMDYSCDGSGATVFATDLENNFGIDYGCNRVYRTYFTTEEWDNLMKGELSSGRPVIYMAYSSTSGHAFVCDGYNESGLFHINWGWEGSCDGYFELSALNSRAESAGAPTDGVGCYNFKQELVYGIQPNNISLVNVPEVKQVYYNDIDINNGIYDKSRKIRMDIDVVESDDNCFDGSVAFQLFDENGNACKPSVIFDEKNLYIKLDGYKNYLRFFLNLSNVANGKYYLKPVFKPVGDTNYKLMRPRYGINSKQIVPIEVTSDKVKVLDDSAAYASDIHVVGDVEFVDGKAYSGFSNGLKIKLHNNGVMYNSPIIVARNVNGDLYKLAENNYVIEEGGDVMMSVSIDAPQNATSDHLEIYALDNSQVRFTDYFDSYKCVGKVEYQLVKPVPGTPKLVIDNYKINRSRTYFGENMKVDFTLRNQGGFYNDDLFLVVFRSEGGYGYVAYEHNLKLDGNDKVSMSVDLDLGDLDEHDYYVLPYFRQNGRNVKIPGYEKLYFTLNTLPQNGDFVRIKTSHKNVSDLAYLSSKEDTNGFSKLQLLPFTEYKNEASGIFYIDNNQLLAYGSGNYVVNHDGNIGFNGIVDKAARFEFSNASSTETGAFNIGSDSGKRYLKVEGHEVNLAGNVNDVRCNFNVESVDALPVKIGSVKYASLFAPVALQIPKDVQAYVGLRNGKHLSLIEVENVIPANTPVILIGEPGTYDFEITENPLTTYQNSLKGSIASMPVPEDGVYTLQYLNNEIGLFKFNGSYLHGFKVYLPSKDAAGVQSLSFEMGGFTGIEENRADDVEIFYDLNGRRVYYPSHGVYITNKGKKVYIE